MDWIQQAVLQVGLKIGSMAEYIVS